MTLRDITAPGSGPFVNETAILEELRRRDLDATRVETVLSEIRRGDLTSLRELGLEATAFVNGAPDLEPAALVAEDLQRTVEHFEVFNFLEVLFALHEATKKLREASREMRLQERDVAQAEALHNAAKIRSAAMINLVVGCVSGAINIGMGLYSFASSTSQLSSIKSASNDMQSAKIAVTKTQNDNNLAKTQMELKQAQAEVQVKQAKVQELQQKKTEFTGEQKQKYDQLQKEKMKIVRDKGMDSDPKTNERYIELDKKMAALKKEAETNKPPELEAALKDLGKAEDKAQSLKTEVEQSAIKAKKTNVEQRKTLEKSIAAKEAEIAKLENAREAGTVENRAKTEQARAELRELRAELTQTGKMEAMLNRPTVAKHLNTARERFETTKARLDPASGDVALRHAEAQAQFSQIYSQSQMLFNRLGSIQMFAQGVSGISQGVGQFLAATDQAKGAEHTAESQKAASKENENAEYYKTFNDMVQSVQSILKECLQAQNQANASIYRNM